MDFKGVQRHFGSSFLVIFAVLFVSVTVYAGDWANWRGPNYDGISTETGFNAEFGEDGPKLLWKAEVGIGFSAVSEANGKSYLMGNKDNKDTVYCFDAAAGNEVWTRSYDQALDPKYYEGGTLTSPTIADGKVYTLSKDGITFCLDANTGNIIWQKDVTKDYGFKRPTWGYSGSVLVVDDLLIMNVGRKGLAIKKSDGSFVWGSDKTPGGYATPVPFTSDGKKCVALFGFKEILGLEAATGKQLWEHTWETKHNVNAADPIIDGNKIFISSGYGTGCAMIQVKDNKVTELWKNKSMKNKMSGSVLIGGALYGPDESKGLVCLDAATGDLLWEEKEYKMGAVAAAGDKLIVLSQKGKLAIVEASKDGYKEISSAQVLKGRCWTTPTLANGRLYVRDSKNIVKCFDVSTKGGSKTMAKKTDAAYWPQWQGPNKDALSTDTGLLKKWPAQGPEMLWSVDKIGKGFSSVVIADGTIYISGMVDKQGMITAIDMDGTVKWSKPYADEWHRSFPGARASVTIDNGKLFIYSGTGVAVCLDAKTGDKIWSVDIIERFDGRHHAWGYGESLLVVGDKVICTAGGEGASVVALSVKDGSTVWKTDELDEKASYSSPIVVDRAGKKVIIQILWQHLVAIDAADGTVLATYDTKDYKPADQRRGSETSTNSPAYLDGYIYLTSGYDSGSALLKISEDATSITKVWENHDLDVHHGGVVIVDGYIYGANWLTNSKGTWICVDFKTGETKYQQDWDGNKGSIGYADGMLYCYQEKEGGIALVKATPEKFEITSSFKITMGEDKHWAHPIIVGGRLYMRHGDVLMVYNVKS